MRPAAHLQWCLWMMELLPLITHASCTFRDPHPASSAPSTRSRPTDWSQLVSMSMASFFLLYFSWLSILNLQTHEYVKDTLRRGFEMVLEYMHLTQNSSQAWRSSDS
jgi:hypothetical protein